MEKKNNSGMLVGILIGIVITLLVVGGLFATGSIGFKTSTTTDNGQTSNNTTEIESYKADDYVTIEKVNIGDEKVNVEKVVFKNLDSSLTQKFTEEQSKLIESAESTYDYFINKAKRENISISGSYIEGTNYLAKSNIWYQINKDILTVYNELKESGELGTATLIAVINIDLKNKKVLTNEELLKLGNTNFNDIATKEYDRVVEECSKQEKSFCYYDGKNRENYVEVTLEEHKKNKEVFIKNIESKLDELIKVYIQDGKIKYDYSPLSIRLVNESIGTGGPHSHSIVEVGEYR